MVRQQFIQHFRRATSVLFEIALGAFAHLYKVSNRINVSRLSFFNVIMLKAHLPGKPEPQPKTPFVTLVMRAGSSRSSRRRPLNNVYHRPAGLFNYLANITVEGPRVL